MKLVPIIILCSCFFSSAFRLRAKTPPIIRRWPMTEATDEEGESPTARRERLRVRAKRMMFNEKGVPYAPWMVRQLDEETLIDILIQREESEGKGSKGKSNLSDKTRAGDTEGMQWSVKDGRVYLAWSTNAEPSNAGFIVERKMASGADFDEISSFNENRELASKGTRGGRYRFIDSTAKRGSWIYRVLDCDAEGKKSVLCQNFVEVETASEQKTQALVVVSFVAFLAIAAAFGYQLDPPR